MKLNHDKQIIILCILLLIVFFLCGYAGGYILGHIFIDWSNISNN